MECQKWYNHVTRLFRKFPNLHSKSYRDWGVPSVIAPSTFFSIWFQWALAGDEGASVGLSNDSRQMESVVKDLKANYRSLEGPMMVKMKKKTLQLI